MKLIIIMPKKETDPGAIVIQETAAAAVVENGQSVNLDQNTKDYISEIFALRERGETITKEVLLKLARKYKLHGARVLDIIEPLLSAQHGSKMQADLLESLGLVAEFTLNLKNSETGEDLEGADITIAAVELLEKILNPESQLSLPHFVEKILMSHTLDPNKLSSGDKIVLTVSGVNNGICRVVDDLDQGFLIVPDTTLGRLKVFLPQFNLVSSLPWKKEGFDTITGGAREKLGKIASKLFMGDVDLKGRPIKKSAIWIAAVLISGLAVGAFNIPTGSDDNVSESQAGSNTLESKNSSPLSKLLEERRSTLNTPAPTTPTTAIKEAAPTTQELVTEGGSSKDEKPEVDTNPLTEALKRPTANTGGKTQEAKPVVSQQVQEEPVTAPPVVETSKSPFEIKGVDFSKSFVEFTDAEIFLISMEGGQDVIDYLFSLEKNQNLEAVIKFLQVRPQDVKLPITLKVQKGEGLYIPKKDGEGNIIKGVKPIRKSAKPGETYIPEEITGYYKTGEYHYITVQGPQGKGSMCINDDVKILFNSQ